MTSCLSHRPANPQLRLPRRTGPSGVRRCSPLCTCPARWRGPPIACACRRRETSAACQPKRSMLPRMRRTDWTETAHHHPMRVRTVQGFSKWSQWNRVRPEDDRGHPCAGAIFQCAHGRPATSRQRLPMSQNEAARMASVQNARCMAATQSRTNFRYFTRCGPTLPNRFLRFSSYSL